MRTYAEVVSNLLYSSIHMQWIEIIFNRIKKNGIEDIEPAFESGAVGAYKNSRFRPRIPIDPDSPAGNYLDRIVINPPFPGVAILPSGVFIPNDIPSILGEFYATGCFSPANSQGYIDKHSIRRAQLAGYSFASSLNLSKQESLSFPGNDPFPPGHHLRSSLLPPGTWIPGCINLRNGFFLPGFGNVEGESYHFRDQFEYTKTFRILPARVISEQSSRLYTRFRTATAKSSTKERAFVLPPSTASMLMESSNLFLTEYLREYARYSANDGTLTLMPSRPNFCKWANRNRKMGKQLHQMKEEQTTQRLKLLLPKVPEEEEPVDHQWTRKEIQEQAKLLAQFQPPPLNQKDKVEDRSTLPNSDADMMDLDDNESVKAPDGSQTTECIGNSPNCLISLVNYKFRRYLEPMFGNGDSTPTDLPAPSLKRKVRDGDTPTTSPTQHPVFEIGPPCCCRTGPVDDIGYKLAAKAYRVADIDCRECYMQ